MPSFVRRNGWLVVAFIAGIGSVYFSFRTRPTATAEGSTSLETLACELPAHDFGIVPQLETISHSFTLTNRSTKAILIRNVRSECGCTATQLSSKELKAGGSTVLDVSLRTDVLSGNLTKRVWIDHSSVDEAATCDTIALVIKAIVKPDYIAEPSSLVFKKGLSQERELQLLPGFQQQIRVKNMDCNSEAITIDVIAADQESTVSTASVLRVRFDSSKWASDRHNAIITIATDSARQPMLNVQVSVY